MGDGEKSRRELSLCKNLECFAGQNQLRFTQLVVDHLNIEPRQPVTQAASKSLQKGFLGGKTGGVPGRACLSGTADILFMQGEQAHQQRAIVLVDEPLKALDGGYIRADSVDHAYLITSPISLTARSIPTRIALAIIEWPILYSS